MGELPNAPISDPRVPQIEGLQIGDHRLSISCAVVEWPDHLCGDDLVLHVILLYNQFNCFPVLHRFIEVQVVL